MPAHRRRHFGAQTEAHAAGEERSVPRSARCGRGRRQPRRRPASWRHRAPGASGASGLRLQGGPSPKPVRPRGDKGAAGPALQRRRERAPTAGRLGVEPTPPGLCAGPRPRPARGARARPGGAGVPGPPPWGSEPSPWGEAARLASPAFTSRGVPPGPAPLPPPSRARPSPLRPFAQTRPGSAPLLAPPPARGPFKSPARRRARGRNGGRGGEGRAISAPPGRCFGLWRPRILLRGTRRPIRGQEAAPNGDFSWSLSGYRHQTEPHPPAACAGGTVLSVPRRGRPLKGTAAERTGWGGNKGWYSPTQPRGGAAGPRSLALALHP